jgi:hypothetical protein
LFNGISGLGAYFFAQPLSLGQGQCSISPILLSVCYDGSLFVFQFCGAVWLWVLLTGSGDDLCDLLPALLPGVAYCPPAVSLPAFPAIVYWWFMQRLAPCPSPLLQCTFSLPTPSAVVLDYSSLFIVQGVFLGRRSVCPGVVLVHSGGCWGNSMWCVVLTCFFCGISHRQVWSLQTQLQQQWQPSNFLSVMCCGEAFHRLGVQGVKGLILVCALLPSSLAPASQLCFGVRAQAICFRTKLPSLILHYIFLFVLKILSTF